MERRPDSKNGITKTIFSKDYKEVGKQQKN